MKTLYTNVFLGDRMREEYGNIEELANDILTNGLINPLLVCPVDDEDRAHPLYKGQDFALIAGGRRWKAHEFLSNAAGRAVEVEIRSTGPITRLRRLVLELRENLGRKDMTWQEQVNTVKKIWDLSKQDNPEITMSEVARDMGVSLAQFSRDVKTAQEVEKRPTLAKASSKKAVQNAAKIAGHHEARALRSSEDKVTLDRAQLGKRLVTADMLKWLPTRETESASLALVDFPYGQDFFKSGQKTRRRAGSETLSAFDDSPEYALDLMTNAVPQIMRVTRETGWILAFMNAENRQFLKSLFADTCRVHHEYRSEDDHKRCFKSLDGESGKCEFITPELVDWIWVRPNSQNNPRYPLLHAKNLHEFIVVVNMGKAVLTRPCNNVLVYEAEYGSERTHVNQKPMPLYEDLISRTTELGDVVIDPAFGSGNSMAAAGKLSRGFYGCDLNEANLDPAVGRVAKHLVFAGVESEVASAKRYEREKGREVEGVTDFSEVIQVAIQPAAKETSESDLLYYVDEVGQVNDPQTRKSGFLCQVRNALHVFVSKRGATQDEAYQAAQELVDELNGMAEVGLIDPKTAAWKDYENARQFLEKGGKRGSDDHLPGVPSLRG